MDEIEVTPILVKTQLGSSRASALDGRIQEKFLFQSPLLAERKTLNQTKTHMAIAPAWPASATAHAHQRRPAHRVTQSARRRRQLLGFCWGLLPRVKALLTRTGAGELGARCVVAVCLRQRHYLSGGAEGAVQGKRGQLGPDD